MTTTSKKDAKGSKPKNKVVKLTQSNSMSGVMLLPQPSNVETINGDLKITLPDKVPSELKKLEMAQKNYEKLFVLYYDFQDKRPRYEANRENAEVIGILNGFNRSPLFDVTTTKFFKTGLRSNEAQKLWDEGLRFGDRVFTYEHPINRTLAAKFIMEELCENPRMSIVEFCYLVREYCSVVVLTKVEHNLVTKRIKEHEGKLSIQLYKENGIEIPGLYECVNKLGLIQDLKKHGYDIEECLTK
jgi:hypothetical protein